MGLKKFSMALNAIDTLIENPCDGDWWLYVKTLLPAVGNEFYIILIPDPKEILEEYLDPSASRRKGKGFPRSKWANMDRGDGRRRRGRRSNWLDVDGTIADRLPGRQYFKMRRVNPLEHIAWAAFNRLELLSWWYLIADLSAGSIINWNSAILESACRDPHAGTRGRWDSPVHTGGTDTFPFVNGNWTADYFENAKYSGTNGLDLPGYQDISFFSSIYFWTDFIGDDIEVRVDVIYRVRGGQSYTQRQTAILKRPGSVWVSNSLFAKAVYNVIISVTAIPGAGRNGHVSFLGTPHLD